MGNVSALINAPQQYCFHIMCTHTHTRAFGCILTMSNARELCVAPSAKSILLMPLHVPAVWCETCQRCSESKRLKLGLHFATHATQTIFGNRTAKSQWNCPRAECIKAAILLHGNYLKYKYKNPLRVCLFVNTRAWTQLLPFQATVTPFSTHRRALNIKQGEEAE